MFKNRRAKISSFAALIAIALLFCLQSSFAQPSGYCIPATYAGTSTYNYYYCTAMVIPQNLTITTNGAATMNFSNFTNNNSSPFVFYGDQGGQFAQGTQSTVAFTMGMGYWGYAYPVLIRMYVDWQCDGSFADNVTAGNLSSDWIFATIPSGYTYYDYPLVNYPNWYYQNTIPTYSFNINTPANAVMGKTRLRFMWEYYYYGYYYCGSCPYSACWQGYYYNGGSWSESFSYGGVADFVITISGGIADTYPTQGSVLYANQYYDNAFHMINGVKMFLQKPTLYFSAAQPASTYAWASIIGPSPATDTVWQGTDPLSATTPFNISGSSKTFFIAGSKGVDSYPASPQFGNGTFFATHGGEYKIIANIVGKPTPKIQTFTVAWQDDLSAIQILSPKSNQAPNFQIYLQSDPINLQGVIENVGMDNITEFTAYMIIYDSQNNIVDSIGYHYQSPPQAVLKGGSTGFNDAVTIDFGTFQTQTVGIYHIRLVNNLLSAYDQEPYNDTIPRTGSPLYTFAVSYLYEFVADSMLMPFQGATVIGNRPFNPIGRFKNLGAADASNVPICLKIRKMVNGVPVDPPVNGTNGYRCTLPDIAQGRYNTSLYTFQQTTITQSGLYQCELTISSTDDQVHGDDTLRTTFTVLGGLSGIYTVGAPEGSYTNIPTIDSAMNALYYLGLAGPVTFYLTNSTYTKTSTDPTGPAWDFASDIINAGYDQTTGLYNTITWAPSPNRQATTGGVVINMNSSSGYGIRFGQSNAPVNTNAIVKIYNDAAHANSSGYITFDGGSQKALQFNMASGSSVHCAAFFLDHGSHDIGIKNCIINNMNLNNSNNITLPSVLWDMSNGFQFSADTVKNGTTWYGYSAGVENRDGIYPMFGGISFPFDTIPNSNNKVNNNVITGFGYGVVSLGYGPLFLNNTSPARYQRFYNSNNQFNGNVISNVARAGIFLGYEENTTVKGNRIYNVGNGVCDAAGIMLGTDPTVSTTTYPGYNNIGLKIDGNEISQVNSPVIVHGIRDEQCQRTYKDAASHDVNFPDVPENVTIMNNVVWGLLGTATSPRIGIHVFTERTSMASMFVPKYTNYWTDNDYIVNNTVRITDNGKSNTGYVAAIALQSTKGAILKNNAILFDSQLLAANDSITALVFYEGLRPSNGGLTSDRNVYYSSVVSPAVDVFRFIEIDTNSNIVEYGSKYEYSTIFRWQSWTGNDMSSVYGSFVNDLVYSTNYPQSLRVSLTPQPPLGSLLNNRGDIISVVTTDIDGKSRGDAGQRYDVGASEFYGRMYTSDLEVNSITAPRAYQAGTGIFANEENIMMPAPIDVKATIRNDGNLQQSNVPITLNIYLSDAQGNYTLPAVKTVTTNITIPSNESTEISFNLASGNKATDFYPQTYSDLPSYKVPALYTSMYTNVTPQYKLVVSVQSDENPNNNTLSKFVRFYLPKAGLSMLISSEQSNAVLTTTSTQDQLAGSMNSDSVRLVLKRLGWFTDVSLGRYDVDMFERTSWEPRAVNYTPYRTMFWTDGIEKNLNLRYMRTDISNFLNSAVAGNDKKNIVIASQEMAKENQTFDPTFTANVLRCKYINSVLPGPSSYAGFTVTGMNIGSRESVLISKTLFNNPPATDANPFGAVIQILNQGDGLTRAGYYWTSYNSAYTPKDSLMGVATTSITKNVIYYAIDWRHFSNTETVIRATIDYILRNGGKIVPVELYNFAAQPVGRRVDLTWNTASENNSSYFEVERANVNASGVGMFESINQVKAAGKSAYTKEYGPVQDYNVNYGQTYVYRLKMVDVDGTSEYSDQKTVTINGYNGSIVLSEAQPNPAFSNVQFTLTLTNTSDIELSVYDLSGKQIQVIPSSSLIIGANPINIDVRDFANGAYNLVLRQGSTIITRQIRVVK